MKTAVAFLTTILNSLDKDDWWYLKQVMKYIKDILGVKMNLREDSLSVINLWVNAPFSTHKYFRGHTGVMMYLGAGSIISGSWKHNISGQSSTDNKLVGVDDIMVPVLWTLYFIQVQGYTVESNIIFQDNHSTMQLILNGKK